MQLVGAVTEVAVVVLVVVGGVLHLVQDDAGGGDAGSLQETDAVDEEGADHLSQQRSRLISLLRALFIHPEHRLSWPGTAWLRYLKCSHLRNARITLASLSHGFYHNR